jgi:hypothetical protein
MIYVQFTDMETYVLQISTTWERKHVSGPKLRNTICCLILFLEIYDTVVTCSSTL